MESNADIEVVVRRAALQLAADLESIQSLAIGQTAGEPDALFGILSDSIGACLSTLTGLGLWGEDNRLPSSILWNAAAPLLSRGWLQNRARTKPRGYAGDYELLTWIYKWRISDDPLGGLFDRFFQSQAAPQAVRNRMALMSDWIANLVAESATQAKVAIVGSALGAEIHDAYQRLQEPQRRRLRAVLLDLDPEGIDAASA